MAFRTPLFGILVRVKVLHSAKLGGDEDRLGSLLQKASDQALAATIPIDVGRIKEGHPGLDGSGEDCRAPSRPKHLPNQRRRVANNPDQLPILLRQSCQIVRFFMCLSD